MVRRLSIFYDPLRYDLASYESMGINREIDIQFTKLDASLMYYHYSRNATAEDRPCALVIASSGVAANLLLTWSETPVSTSIPRTLDLQVWGVREFQDSVSNGAVLVNDAIITARSSLIQLNSVPSIIITHLERDKDENTYQPTAMCSQSTVDATDPVANVRSGGVTNNWDDWGEINTLTYLLGDNPNVISATFSQRELYDLTVKNSKNFPYSYGDWRGKKRPRYSNIAAADATTGRFTIGVDVRQAPETFTAAWVTYPCKGMVAVTGQDIANKTSTGVFSSNSLQIVASFRPHSGFGGVTGGGHVYQFYNHLVFGKEFLRIELIVKIWLMWCVKTLLTYLAQGISLELTIPLMFRNIHNSYWEN